MVSLTGLQEQILHFKRKETGLCPLGDPRYVKVQISHEVASQHERGVQILPEEHPGVKEFCPYGEIHVSLAQVSDLLTGKI